MKIAIIGAGFTALSAALELVKLGHQVEIFEKSEQIGGLAAGFKAEEWSWYADKHYHHVFTKDQAYLDLLKEVGVEDKQSFFDVVTATLIDRDMEELDSPLSLLTFPKIGLIDKVKTAIILGLMKILPLDGKVLDFAENQTAYDFLKKNSGQKTWQLLWQPLLQKKFGHYAQEVNLAWFWARIKARSKKLGYFHGGFMHLAEILEVKLKDKGVIFHYKSRVSNVSKIDSSKQEKKQGSCFDYVFLTTTSSVTQQIVDTEAVTIPETTQLAAQTLVLELKEKFLPNNIYWLNVNNLDYPFLAVVEHSNLIQTCECKLASKNYVYNQTDVRASKSSMAKPKVNFRPLPPYNGSTILYLGRYLNLKDDSDLSKFNQGAEETLKEYQPYLEKINHGYDFQANFKKSWLWKSRFAQPIVKINHSQHLPKYKLDSGLFWASIEHIYPWDRGINFAIKEGKKVVQMMDQESRKEQAQTLKQWKITQKEV